MGQWLKSQKTSKLFKNCKHFTNVKDQDSKDLKYFREFVKSIGSKWCKSFEDKYYKESKDGDESKDVKTFEISKSLKTSKFHKIVEFLKS